MPYVALGYWGGGYAAGDGAEGSYVFAANSTQPNVASAGGIAQTHQVGAASSGTGHTGTTAAVSQTHLISAASSQQANTATAGGVTSSAPGAAVWPLASQVLAGVVYGPTGIEYTGLLNPGVGVTVYVEQILSDVVDNTIEVLLQ